MVLVNAMGKLCPIPVVEAKKAMSQLPAEGGQVQVLVDNDIACQNLEKLASGTQSGFACTKTGENAYEVVITVNARGDSAAEAPADEGGAGLVVAVASDRMGDGADELGRILIKGFLYALSETEEPPESLLFYNSGARLTAEGSNALADLRKMQEKGSKILTCGTCADFYGIKDSIAVGEITNMYGIVTAMADAKRLLRP